MNTPFESLNAIPPPPLAEASAPTLKLESASASVIPYPATVVGLFETLEKSTPPAVPLTLPVTSPVTSPCTLPVSAPTKLVAVNVPPFVIFCELKLIAPAGCVVPSSLRY